MNTSAIADMAAADHEDGYQNAPVGLLSLDGDLRLHRINDTLLRWLGRERSELGQFHREGLVNFPDLAGVLSERSISMLRNHVQGLPRNGTAATIELSVFGGNSQFFKVELCSAGVFDARGNLLYTQTSVIDVSARSEIEHRLRARVDMLQMLTDRTPSQLAYYDKNLICHFSNAAHAASYGREPADLVGLHLSEIVSPAVLPEIIPKVAKALSGERLQFEAQRLTSDGKARFYDIRYLPDFADEWVMGYFVELVDITDRRRTEDFVFNANLDLEERMALRTAELHRSELRYHLVTETVREYGILFLDVDGGINDWTESARRLHGFDPSEVMGRGLDALLMDADPASQIEGTSDASALLQRCIEAGHAEGANWCARADGTRFWALTTLTALRDPNDDLYGFSVVIRDLTEARRLAELSRQTNLQLNATVAEQSDALAKVNKDLDVFSYTVAHDLRAPLRHISQFLHLAQEELGDPTDHPALPLVKRASAASRQMAAMIEGLLEYTRIGQVAFSMQEVPLAALVLGISGHLRAEQGKRRIDWQIDPDMPSVSSDPIMLGEAIGKLLENAVKFTRSNPEARIEVGVKSTEDGRGIFYVKDNGVGFDLSRAKNLYLMFQRQHHSMDFEGHGMGLALAHRIIERHGGKMGCETSPGQGCCFFFDLPLAKPVLMQTDITL